MDVRTGVAAGAGGHGRAGGGHVGLLQHARQIRPHLEAAGVQRDDAVVEPGQVEQRLDQPAQPLGLLAAPCASSPGRRRRRRRRRSPARRAARRWGCAARARRWRPAPCGAGRLASRSSAMRLIVSARSPSSSRRSRRAPGGCSRRARWPWPPSFISSSGAVSDVRHELRDQQCGDHREDRDEAQLGLGVHRDQQQAGGDEAPRRRPARPSLVLIENGTEAGAAAGSRAAAAARSAGAVRRRLMAPGSPARSRRRARYGSARRRSSGAAP